MTGPQDGLDRIEQYFDALCDGVRRCREAGAFVMADWQDAYDRLVRLRDRYLHEKSNNTLTPAQADELKKVFEDDAFMSGMRHARLIGAHVVKGRGSAPVLYALSSGPLTLTAESSCLALFAGPAVALKAADGKQHSWDHLRQLEEAERRIAAAITRARSA